MHSNWTSFLSIFNTSKFFRTVSGSDARNIRLPGSLNFKDLWRTSYCCRNAISSLDATFGIQDTMKSEVLPSTSASIVKAGLNKVWKRPRLVEPIPASHAHSSQPRSGVSPVPLQKVQNEKQPEQSIIHPLKLESVTLSPALQPAAALTPTRLPSLLTSRPFTSIDPPPASLFVNLLFSLQKLAKDEQPGQDIKPVETSGHLPQPTVTPFFTHLPLPQISRPERESFTPANTRHPSGSRFLSLSLQSAVNENEASRAFSSIQQPLLLPHLLSAEASQTKFDPIFFTPKQDTIFPHVSSSNATQKQLPIKTKSLRSPSPSGSQTLQSPLQEVPTEQHSEWDIIRDPVPRLPAAHIFRSSATKCSEGFQRGLGLSPFVAGQDPFYLPPVSSPYATQRFLSDLPPDIIPPEQSLLFLPPNPHLKRKINFNPFSPEEGTMPLPPVPINNRLGYNILPSPLLSPDQVSYLSLFPAIPSPLPLALLLSPRPTVHPPNELYIKIAGPEGYLNAENHESHITHFLLSRVNKVANSLIVVWQRSHVDNGGARGMMSLKALFAKLNETMLGSGRVALSSFSKLSITIPDLVKDAIPCDNLLESFKEDDSIDLTNASDLLEFAWSGDFAVLGLKFNHLPMANLTVLNVNSTHISLNDALQLLHSCPNVGSVNLGTIQDVGICDFGNLRKPSEIPHMIFGNLWSITLESNVALHSFFERVGWSSWVSLVLTLRQDAVVDVYTLPISWKSCRDIIFNSHMTAHALTRLKDEYPSLEYNDIGS